MAGRNQRQDRTDRGRLPAAPVNKRYIGQSGEFQDEVREPSGAHMDKGRTYEDSLLIPITVSEVD